MVFPQLQVAVTASYFGCISAFMVVLLVIDAAT
jgi:hypothetical protein